MFKAKFSLNAGLDFYISEIEDIVAPEFVELGGNLIALRREIRKHIECRYAKGKGATDDIAISAVTEMATRHGFGIADIVETKGSRYIIKSVGPQKSAEIYLIPNEREASARLYSSNFLENKDKPLEVILVDILTGKPVEFKGDKLYEVLIKKVAESVEKGAEGIGATLFDQELARQIDKRISKWADQKYDGSDLHKRKAAYNLYYSKLAGLNLKAEIEKLKEKKERLEAELSTVEIADESAQDYIDKQAQIDNIEEEIKKKEEQVKSRQEPNEPTEEEYQEARITSIKGIDVLIGSEANPIKRKVLDNVKDDFKKQIRIAEKVRETINPLYVKIKLAREWRKNIVQRVQEEPPEEESNFINNTLLEFYMTEKPFDDAWMQTIRKGLQRFHLTIVDNNRSKYNRFEYYEDLKKSLANPEELAEKIATPVPQSKVGNYPVETTLSLKYPIQATCRYYLDGKITEEQARQTFDRLKDEELARKLFFRTFDELEEKLNKEASKRSPSNEEFEGVFDIFIDKVHVVMPEFTSVIEERYPRDGERLLKKAVDNLAYDYWETYRFVELIAKANVKTSEELVYDFIIPKSFIRLWEKIGDRKPSRKELFEVYKDAASLALRAKPNLRVWFQEEKRVRKKHLQMYMPNVTAHKNLLEMLYQVAPLEVIDEYYTTNKVVAKIRNWFPGIFFKV